MTHTLSSWSLNPRATKTFCGISWHTCGTAYWGRLKGIDILCPWFPFASWYPIRKWVLPWLLGSSHWRTPSFLCSRPVILSGLFSVTPQHHLEHLINTDYWAQPLKFLIQEVWGRAQKFLIFNNSTGYSDASGPGDFEHQCYRSSPSNLLAPYWH